MGQPHRNMSRLFKHIFILVQKKRKKERKKEKINWARRVKKFYEPCLTLPCLILILIFNF